MKILLCIQRLRHHAIVGRIGTGIEKRRLIRNSPKNFKTKPLYLKPQNHPSCINTKPKKTLRSTILTKHQRPKKTTSHLLLLQSATNPKPAPPKKIKHPAPAGTTTPTPSLLSNSTAGKSPEKRNSRNILGDCYLMAGMAAVAKSNPDAIKKLIKAKDDGTFDVTLYIKDESTGKRSPKVINVTAEFPKKKDSSKPRYAGFGDVTKSEEGTIDKRELWPMLLEKAFAQYNYGYDAIESGSAGKAMELFTGGSHQYHSLNSMEEDNILTALRMALDAKIAITASSKDDLKLDGSKTKEGVVPNHAYVVMEVDTTKKTISLYNPWSIRHLGKSGDVGGTKRDLPAISIKTFKDQFHGFNVLKP